LPPKDDFCRFTFRKFQTVSEKISFRKFELVSEKNSFRKKSKKHFVKVYNDPEMSR
jgi:hypothetical protein